jgi:hypothetical protein
MNEGELLTRALAIVAVGCYLLRVLLDLRNPSSLRIARVTRWVWTIGCVMLWLHIAAAFHFIHDWSHASAVQETAAQTRRLTGFDFGGGVYFNYVFAMLWLIDAALWWRQGFKVVPQSPARFWTIHAAFAFMMINATVVFGPAYWRYVGIGFAALILVLFLVAPNRTGERGA